MKIIPKVKSYMLTPRECFIPRCKARCCTNVPLPEDFITEERKPFLQREIYSAINIGINDIEQDNFNSIIYNTTLNPLQLVGISPNGVVLGIPKHIIDKLNEQQLKWCYENYNQYHNYCPFITEQARCSIYEQRPRICREYGSFPGLKNICSEKSSRFDKIKFYFTESFTFYRDLILKPFRKTQKTA